MGVGVGVTVENLCGVIWLVRQRSRPHSLGMDVCVCVCVWGGGGGAVGMVWVGEEGVDLNPEADAHDDERGTLITDAPMALDVGT